MDDEEIIDLFFERSEQAILELSKKYGGRCRKVARNILNNPSDAEECVNDAYLGVWNSIPPQRPNPLPAYLCRIVRNLSIKKYHANTAQKRNSTYDIALEELEPCLPSSDTTDQEADARELAIIINSFLGSLDRDSRVMFVRRYWFSDPLSEIAKRFGISEHNASVRLFRIRAKLKKHFRKEGVFL